MWPGPGPADTRCMFNYTEPPHDPAICGNATGCLPIEHTPVRRETDLEAAVLDALYAMGSATIPAGVLPIESWGWTPDPDAPTVTIGGRPATDADYCVHGYLVCDECAGM